jgi:hypothetical protein
MDTECYRNYWSIAFRCVDTGRVARIRLTPHKALDRQRIARIFKNWRVISFNGWNYDMPMITLAMSGATNSELKRASDEIIMADLRPYTFYEKYGLELPSYLDHIDLMEVSPGSPQKPSLKMYAGRLHSHTMMDLPFDPDHVLSNEDIELLEEYHDNDLQVTQDFYFELKPQIELRAQMSEQYGVDLRSKSDAQVAEAVIKTEIERSTKRRIYRPEVNPGMFRYVPPQWVCFQTPQMQEIFNRIVSGRFLVKNNGQVEMPAFLEDLDIKIGNGVYRMGIGGLHSSENKQVCLSDDEFVILDRDVTSYYPSIILNNNLFPKHIGEGFLKVYRSIFERRVAAKKAGNKTVAETLKIVLNGSFGKFGSPYSVLYSPNLMIQTTVTGQLSLLMLIEELEMRGIHVVSANTDGFVTRVPVSRRSEFNAVCMEWEWTSGFGLEETHYRGLWSRDVNNYVAITSDGKIKNKGAFAKGGPGLPGAMGMKKNPTNEICIEALEAFLKDGTPIEQTIRACTDIRKFVTIRRVNGGCVDQDGELVGKVIRFYYAEGVKGTLKYKNNGNDVPKTEGAKPLMTLPDEFPDEFPDDIDYEWYVRETTAMMQDVGLTAYDPKLANRTGTMLARLGDQVTFHHVRLPNGVAECGKAPESIRERWTEHNGGSEKIRLCPKCRRATEL